MDRIIVHQAMIWFGQRASCNSLGDRNDPAANKMTINNSLFNLNLKMEVSSFDLMRDEATLNRLVTMTPMKCLFLILFISIWPVMAFAANLEMSNYRIGGSDAETRFVIDLSQKASFSVEQADASHINVILPRLAVFPDFSRTRGNLLIKKITVQNQKDKTILALELKQPATPRQAFAIPAKENVPYRIVIDLIKGAASATSVKKTPAGQFLTVPTPGDIKTGKSQPPVKAAVKTKLDGPVEDSAVPPARKGKSKIIVIDAGHGGIDPGASGTDGAHEKDITLAMAKELRSQLQKNSNYKIILTRDKDIFIPLKGRRDIARQNHADLFVSLHADSMGSGDGGVRGASFYTISNEASDAESAKLAARENLSDTIAGIDIGIKDDAEVAGILIDLTMRETMNQSKRLASKLSDNFGASKITVLQKPLRAAGFAVLKSPDVPSVLIEMGFLSSPQEVAQLQSPPYRTRLAGAIAAGVNKYFSYLDESN